MKVLHTADWHLGAELKRIPRLSDQLARVAEILELCDEHDVELLLIVGDFIDESRADRLPMILRPLGALLRPRLENGLQVVVVAGNHDRPHIFPLLQASRDLFLTESSARLHFVSKPRLMTVIGRDGVRLRLMLLPYPDQNAYDLEAIRFTSAADRHAQLGAAVKQRIRDFESEIRRSEKIPTVVAAHLLIAGQRENGHELTEEADVPIPRTYLPNFGYVALGHVHKPTVVGGNTSRYCGSIERMNFGEASDAKHVVIVDFDKSGLVADPQPIGIHAVELRELAWTEGDDLVDLARGISRATICKLTLSVPVGTNVQRVQAEARTLIERLCWPPDVNWIGGANETSGSPTSLALARSDWQGALRSYVASQLATDDPDRVAMLTTVEELITMESAS